MPLPAKQEPVEVAAEAAAINCLKCAENATPSEFAAIQSSLLMLDLITTGAI